MQRFAAHAGSFLLVHAFTLCTEGNAQAYDAAPGNGRVEAQASGSTSNAPESDPGIARKLRDTLTEASLADYESAMMLWEDGDFRGAKLKFQLVHEKSGDPRLLWNIAVCEKALRHYAKALPLVRQYLTEAQPWLTDEERAEAEALARAIENFVGPVVITTSQSSASIFVDDELIGKSPLKKPVLLDMGDHTVTVRKHGFKEGSAHIRVLGPTPQQSLTVGLERDIPAATLEVRAGSGQWIWIDGSEVGKDRWEGLVSPGIHQIRVTGVGYKTQDVKADLTSGGHATVWVTPRPLDPSEKGYLWPLVGVLTGMTAIAAVVAYYGLRPSETRAQVPESGRLGEIQVSFVRGGF